MIALTSLDVVCCKKEIIVISNLCKIFSGVIIFRALVVSITKFLDLVSLFWSPIVTMNRLSVIFDAVFDDFNAAHHKVQHKDGKSYLDLLH